MSITDSQKTAVKVWSVITALLWTGWLYARVSVGGTCQKPQLQRDFDPEKYLGVWYEQYRSYTVRF